MPGYNRVLAALAVSTVAAATLTAALSSPVAAARPDPEPPTGSVDERPNIVLITSDDQTVADMAVMGSVGTQLVDRGTYFANSFAPFPLCCPDRASILTGQYAHNHGVLGNGSSEWPLGGYAAFDGSTSLATWLQDAGYQTTFVGKYLNHYGETDPLVAPPGWAEWHGTVHGGDYMNTHMFEDGVLKSYEGVYQTDVYRGISEDVISRHAAGDAPFFLWTSYYAPHNGRPEEVDDPINVYGRNFGTPAVANRHRDDFSNTPLPRDPSFDELDITDKPQYVADQPSLGPIAEGMLTELYQQRLESLQALDQAVAGTIAALRSSGELGNTIIIFTSDNGYMLGEHRVPQGKVRPYEPSVRVPLVIRGPGFPAGVTRQQLVATIDLAPTVVRAAQATAGVVIDGVPLQPMAVDPAADVHRAIVLEAGPKTIGSPMFYTGLRTERWKYIEYATGEAELYDLTADPYELQNLANDLNYATRRAELAARLALLRDCTGAACRK